MEKQLSLFNTQQSELLSSGQRKTISENPYYRLFSGKSSDELLMTEEMLGKYYYSQHPLLEAFWAAQTVAYENLLRSLDERLLFPNKGSFDIRVKDGATDRHHHRVNFKYEPDYKHSDKIRTELPKSSIQFVSEHPSPISATGFYHYSMDCLPFTRIKSLEDLIRVVVKELIKADEYEIIFN